MNKNKIPEQCIPGITRLVEYWLFKAFTAGVTASHVHGVLPEDEQRARLGAKTLKEKLHVESVLSQGIYDN